MGRLEPFDEVRALPEGEPRCGLLGAALNTLKPDGSRSKMLRKTYYT